MSPYRSNRTARGMGFSLLRRRLWQPMSGGLIPPPPSRSCSARRRAAGRRPSRARPPPLGVTMETRLDSSERSGSVPPGTGCRHRGKGETMADPGAPRPDTSDMTAVHQVFRSSLSAAPPSWPVPRATTPGGPSSPTTTPISWPSWKCTMKGRSNSIFPQLTDAGPGQPGPGEAYGRPSTPTCGAAFSTTPRWPSGPVGRSEG